MYLGRLKQKKGREGKKNNNNKKKHETSLTFYLSENDVFLLGHKNTASL